VLLSVLVDVIGTNLSRTDYGVAYRDDLGASCELTYYAINPKNQVLINPKYQFLPELEQSLAEL